METIKRIFFRVFNSKKFGSILIVLVSLFLAAWSLGNHYLFKTAALDLGLFNKAVYDYAHLQQNYITLLLDDKVVNFLGDHFSLIVVLLSPLYYIFGSYALLIVQLVFVAMGAVYIRKYILLKTQSQLYANLGLLHFFSIWGIYAAISFDFHTNVLAALMVPALLYEFEKRNWAKFTIIFVLMLLCRENIGFWMGFLMIGFHIKNKFAFFKSRPTFHSTLIILPFIYSVVVTSYIIPGINHTVEQAHYLRFQALGHTTGEVAQYVFLHPVEVLKLIFTNTSPDPNNDMVKAFLHISVIASGGILFLIRPVFLLMLLPIYLQKMLGYDSSLWGVNYHYSIEFVPLLTLLVFEVSMLFKRVRYRLIFYLFFIVTSLGVSMMVLRGEMVVFQQSLSTFLKNKNNSLSMVHETYDLLAKVPRDAIVCAHSNMTPHLSSVKKIYAFPLLLDADYIVTFKQYYSTYPLSEEQYKDTMNYYTHHFTIVSETSNAVLLKKK